MHPVEEEPEARSGVLGHAEDPSELARPVSLSGLHANLPASDLPHGLGLGEERLDPPQLLELLVLLRDVLADRVEELLLGNGDRAPEDPPVAAAPVEETGLVR